MFDVLFRFGFASFVLLVVLFFVVLICLAWLF